MKLLYLLQALFGAVPTASKHARFSIEPGTDVDHRDSSGGTGKFIIEVEQRLGPATVAHQLLSRPNRMAGYYREFDCSDVFSGIVLETDSENVDTLRQMDGVVNVWPMSTVSKPRVEKSTHVSPSIMGNYSIHRWTGVDKLHAKGIRGKGATVAVVDTGIDYTHKALGGCFGPGCKVAGGFDLVGPDWDSKDEKHYPKRPDEDPMDYHGHGTHVAGIIGARNNWLTGVAPDARLLAFKVFSDNPWETDEETIMQALCDAYNAGADVITTSIGQLNGFSDNPWAVLSNRLVDRGIVIIASAGNDGESGPFYSSTGSMGEGVLAVAAANVSSNPRVKMSDPSVAPRPVYFTTWGPSNELLLKPDIAAPGTDIVSTVLNQSYEELSGTSMSAPYIAGIAALYVGAYGGREFYGAGFAKMLHDRISSSGKSLPWLSNQLDGDFRAPPFQVGTGLVDALKVLNYDTQLTYKPFSLKDTELFEPRWTFNITNNGKKKYEYTFELESQAGFNILDSFYGVAPLYELQPETIVPNVTLPDPIVVLPGNTREVEVTFALPDVDDDFHPMYGGKVWVLSSHGEKLSIPYGGAAYDTEKAFDTMFISDPVVADEDGDWAWAFDVENTPNDYIEISARLSYPCTYLRWDIFDDTWTESMWHYPLQVGRRGYIGAATTYRDSNEYWYFDPSINDKADTLPFPLTRVPRGLRSFWWIGKLANGTQIAPGNYTIRFAALRPYGNPRISDHWDIMPNKVKNIMVLPSTSNSTSNSNQTYKVPRRQV